MYLITLNFLSKSTCAILCCWLSSIARSLSLSLSIILFCFWMMFSELELSHHLLQWAHWALGAISQCCLPACQVIQSELLFLVVQLLAYILEHFMHRPQCNCSLRGVHVSNVFGGELLDGSMQTTGNNPTNTHTNSTTAAQCLVY